MASHELEVMGGPAKDEVKKSVLAVMDHTGDTKIMWDADNEAEVEVAKKTFDSLRKKGYSAFKTNKKGEAGERITEFDPQAERLIMAPQLQGG